MTYEFKTRFYKVGPREFNAFDYLGKEIHERTTDPKIYQKVVFLINNENISKIEDMILMQFGVGCDITYHEHFAIGLMKECKIMQLNFNNDEDNILFLDWQKDNIIQ